jgi:uncharacterized RmlC-like cupin family protein
MAAINQVLDNPVTGEHFVYRKTAQSTGGTLLEVERVLKPYAGKVALAHFHAAAEERYEIITGSACYQLDYVEHQATGGEVIEIPANRPHLNPWNAGDQELHMRHIMRPKEPALDILIATEGLFETLYVLACAGKVKPDGVPSNPLQLAVLLHALQPGTYLAGVPIGVQHIVIGALAKLGRILGYRADHRVHEGIPQG